MELWQGWQNDLQRALRRDGHRVMRCTLLFLQQGPPSTVLGCKCQDRFIEDFLDWSTTLSSGFVPEGLDFLERCRPRSRCGGAREAMLCLWISLYEELVHGWGCSRPAAPRATERRGRNRWNAAACLRASWYLSTTESTASPNSPEGASRPSIRKTLSFSFMSDRVNHKCLSAATGLTLVLSTSAAMDRPMARAVWRGELNQRFSSALWYHSNWFARPHLALSACRLDMLVAQTSCEDMRQPDLLPCTPCPPALMIHAGGQDWSLQRRCRTGWQIARERLFNAGHRSVTTLT